MFSVLRHRRYARLFTAQVIALLGTGILTVALGLRAFDIAGADAGRVLGTVLAIKMAAYVLVAPVATAVLARVPRRAVLVTADLIRASVALGLPFVDHAWQIYLLVAVLQSASAVFTPTFTAVIPEILDEDDYTSALALSRLAYDLEALVSPLLTAALLTVVSTGSLFFATVAGFVGSALVVVSVTLPPPARVPESSTVLSRTVGGARDMLTEHHLRVVLALNAVVASVVALVLVNSVVWVRELLQRSEADVALTMAAFGVGSMSVALALRRLLTVFAPLSVSLAGALLATVALAGSAVLATSVRPGPAGWISVLLVWLMLGVASSMVLTPSNRVIRDHTEADALPRVFAAQFALSHLCFAVTYPLVGSVGARWGQGAAAAAMATISAAALVVAFGTWRRHLRTDQVTDGARPHPSVPENRS